MAFDTSSPLIQAIISQGQSNGYSPIQIGAIASRALAENGGNTNGTPGDNGQSYGGMQWNNDRLDNLKSYASTQGTSWDDPSTQAQFIYHELGGSEGKAGAALKAAQDPTSAANAIMGYVRPAGYTSSTPQNGAGYGNTLAGTQAIGNAISTGSAGGSAQDDSAPMQEGRSVAVTPQGVGSTTSAMNALPGYQPTFGNQLQMAGAALMSRDNPLGASQLLAQAKQSEQTQLLASGFGQWEDKGTSPNGQQIMQVNKLTGQMRYLPMPTSATGLNAKQALPSQKEQSMFEDNQNIMQSTVPMMDAANTLRQHILDGSLTMKWDQQAKAYVANYTGNSDQSSVDIKNATALINQGVGNVVRGEKGALTNAKMQQAMMQIVPAGGQFDPVTMADALGRLTKLNSSSYKSAADANIALATRKGGLLAGVPDDNGGEMTGATLRDQAYGNINRWNDFDKSFAPQFDTFKAAHFGQNNNTSSPKPFRSFLGLGNN